VPVVVVVVVVVAAAFASIVLMCFMYLLRHPCSLHSSPVLLILAFWSAVKKLGCAFQHKHGIKCITDMQKFCIIMPPPLGYGSLNNDAHLSSVCHIHRA